MTVKHVPIDVTAAIICRDEQVLIAKRKEGHLAGRWEFPGGKQEPSESLEQCLVREIQEELALQINVLGHFHSCEHAYDSKVIRLHGFMADMIGGEVELHSHDEVAWVKVSALLSYDFAPADIPIVQRLLESNRTGAG